MIDRMPDGAGHFHAVKFYESRESLCRIVGDFLGEGLSAGQPVLMIATPEHRAGIVAELAARHFNTEAMVAAGDLLLVDAESMLATFVVDGVPDANRFFNASTSLIEQLCRGEAHRSLRAYGEMVDVLWKAGQEVAAIRVEMLWNQLAGMHKLALLCGYSMGSFYKSTSLSEIQDQHSHVLGDSAVLSYGRGRQLGIPSPLNA